MKVTKEELNTLIQEALQKKMETLKEDVNFTAKRNIVMAAQHASQQFENEIMKAFNLVHPDQLPGHIQEQYFAVVKEMEEGVVHAVKNAVRKLVRFPKNKKGRA
jgi:hypothetical protein